MSQLPNLTTESIEALPGTVIEKSIAAFGVTLASLSGMGEITPEAFSRVTQALNAILQCAGIPYDRDLVNDIGSQMRVLCGYKKEGVQ